MFLRPLTYDEYLSGGFQFDGSRVWSSVEMRWLSPEECRVVFAAERRFYQEGNTCAEGIMRAWKRKKLYEFLSGDEQEIARRKAYLRRYGLFGYSF